ncbi:hypothetical protein N7E81_04780 [Reichenbachiella carrageenanivorans]|uniref:WD40-like Beta Propeller Repeat n=1 Tax=Reichenbachiella carrageenanivorans TaxID=2979869 RepID=A0ABY6D5S2_9BACT|nr:hypothetical protein [Reichenbachiella carrageenanivorans]UXX80413.1 hypothetical protein N7E81_04780 [Reichenbachiella carrageenanivorans]
MKIAKLNLWIVMILSLICESSYGQITLKKFDDPALGGQIESIIFGDSDGTNARTTATRKEFNIQENNPYNKLNYQEKGIAKDGSSLYKASRSQFNQLRRVSNNTSHGENNSSENLEARSHAFVSQSGQRAVVSYNMFLYGSEGDPSDQDRVSTIYVLDAEGNIANRFENIPSDAFEPTITSNGKYLAYCYGERMAHSGNDIESGIKIMDLANNNVYFELKKVTVRGLVFSDSTLKIVYSSQYEKDILILDETDGGLYKLSNSPHKFSLGYLKFKNSKTGEFITKTDLIKIK